MTKKRALVAAALAAGIVLIWWIGRRNSTDSAATRSAHAGDSADAFEPNPRLRQRVSAQSLPKANVAGRVVDPDGGVLSGARVCGYPSGDDLTYEQSRFPRCTVSDDQGRFALADLTPAQWSINATAAGYVPGVYSEPDRGGDPVPYTRLQAGEHKDGADIVLEPGGVKVQGVVRDIGGGGIAGAWVTVNSRSSWRKAGRSIIATDDAGEFTAWTKKGRISVRASADGYADGGSGAIAPGQFVEVLMTPESVLTGTVIDAETKKPVALARVVADSQEAVTGDRGEFRIIGLEAGRYKPSAEIAGAYGKAKQSVLLGLGQTVDGVVIELHPAFVVTGTVSVAGGQPCEDASVILVDARTERRFSGYSDEDGAPGRVEIEAVLPGTYEVNARCDDHLSRDDYPDITVTADVLDQRWEVLPGAVIRGTVKDERGQPVDDANVSADLAGASWSPGTRHWEQVEPDGRFEIKGVAAGTWRLEPSAEGLPHPEKPVEVQVDDGGSADVELVLPSGGSIVGSVVDEDGKPVKAASVRAVGSSRRSWRNRTSTLDDGSFEIEGVAAGDYRVTASGSARYWGGRQLRRPGSSDDDLQGEPVQVRAGEAARVKLVVERQVGIIRGRVLDESGGVVTDAFVAAERQSERAGALASRARRSVRWQWRRTPAVTDMDGTFELTELSPGTYVVRAHRRGGGEAMAEGVQVGSDVTLTISAVGSIAGSVQVDGSPPPDEFTIYIRDRESGFGRAEHFFRTDGTWIMRDLPAGRFEVSVESGMGTAKKLDVVLADGQDITGLRLQLEARATVTGQVVALDTGEPLAGYHIHVRAVKGSASTPWMWGVDRQDKLTRDDGRFEVELAPAGRVWVGAWAADWEAAEYGTARKLATLAPGETTDVGVLKAPRRRTKLRERSGDLGFTIKDTPPGTEPEDHILEVAHVRPDGPAADSGLEVGDVIEQVDGNDVRGANSHLFRSLTAVPANSRVVLGLARGDSVTITAGEPR